MGQRCSVWRSLHKPTLRICAVLCKNWRLCILSPTAAQASSGEVLRAADARLAVSFGGESAALPLAKAVPLVAALGQDLLSPAGRPPLARLEAVRSLSARVYGCCFCETA